MTSDRSFDDAMRASLLRFDLAVQRNHLLVYTAGFTFALIGKLMGVFPLRFAAAVLLLTVSFTLALTLSMLLARGVSRTIVNPIWMTADIIFVSIGIYATGGITSPWYVWYLTTAGAAAFAGGRRPAYLVSLGNTIAYLLLLTWMGHIQSFNYSFVLALARMLFVFGASWFFLDGIANLNEKRQRVRQLENDAKNKVAQLTQLTEELKQKSEELSDANRRIREADRMKSQFLANMSHELRTPMNSIIGFSEILVERLNGKVEQKHLEFLHHILTSGQHLLSIINDVLDLSKIEAGKMEIFPERFNVRSLVKSVCSLTRGMSKTAPPFIVDVPDDIEIETDLAKFKQVLFNLLSNAVKFSPVEKVITIRGRVQGSASGRSLHMEVSDQGIGIDPSHHEMIFQEFRQVDATVRREFGGTGLGLALVKRFVELQGGTVGVASAPGLGSTFWFTLPLESQAAVVNRPADIAGESERSRDVVIVVEDDTNAYELIAAALASAGFVPVRARHGDEALRLARELNPVAITLDLVLPGLDGWEVLKRLKADEVTREIPVVIISVIENRELGVALGADDYFTKPVERDRFIARIRAITAPAALRPRLLLIDDDPSVHALLEAVLESIGFGLVHAYSGEEGIQAASDTRPDLIVLDLMMPGMNGFEVAGQLKLNPETARLPIVVLTSKDITAADRVKLNAKVQSFVQKGHSAGEELVSEIRRLHAKTTVVREA